jgi:hypothetical protein
MVWFFDEFDSFSLVLDGTNGPIFTSRFSFQKNVLEDALLFSPLQVILLK